MVRRDGAETRRQRIAEINRSLKGIGEKGVQLNKFVAAQMLKTGLTRAKILEYLTLLQEIGNITIDHDVNSISEVPDSSIE